MQVNNKRAIKQFMEKHPLSEAPLNHWVNNVEAANWTNPADVSATFNKADCVNSKWLFNVGGNNYRLAALIWFQNKIVHVLKVMTHEEYDREVW